LFEAADIREWRRYDVVDAEGHKIGELEAVYVDTVTDLPSFGTVEVGLPTRHRLVFVALGRATVGWRIWSWTSRAGRSCGGGRKHFP
jgi:hypothetical protein